MGKITLTCERCAKDYRVSPSLAYPGRRYCSNACRRDRIVRACEHCGKQFEINPSTAAKGHGRYCQRACMEAAKSRALTRNCAQCGKAFKAPPGADKLGIGIFCSNDCKFASRRIPVAERFWQKVQRAGPDECWEWQGHRNKEGYGSVRVGGAMKRAHRVALNLTGTFIPEGAVVRHSCDNPACVNPAHLQTGTQSENVRDMVERGRYLPSRPRGERHSSTSLKDADVLGLRRRYRAGEKSADLALEFSMSKTAMWALLTGKTWRHLREETGGSIPPGEFPASG